MPINPDVFCAAPFLAVSCESYDNLMPCCAFRSDASVPVHQFESWWRDGLAELRADMRAGRKNPGCRRCYQEEEQGINSVRQMITRNYLQDALAVIDREDPDPISFMIGIGTHCNLRCIFCNPWRSSAIAQEYERNQAQFRANGLEWLSYPIRASWQDQDRALDVLKRNITHAREIHFTGGEPLLTPDYLDLLSAVPDPRRVTLKVNTSLERLSDRWIETLKKFDSYVFASVESPDRINDYVRHGSAWTEVEANINRLRENGIRFKITHVLTRISCWTLPRLIAWMQSNEHWDLQLHVLDSPECLKIAGATAEERRRIIDMEIPFGIFSIPDLASIKQLMHTTPYDPAIDQAFWNYIDMIDSIHDQDFRSMIKDLHQ